MNVEILITNNGITYKPGVQEGIEWATERIGSPGKLTFTVIKDDILNFQEGNHVTMTVDGVNVFYGFVFTKKRNKNEMLIDVTAYDQLRYLKNKDTYVYTDKTASDVIKMIASDFRLKLGTIDQTSFVIPSRCEDNTTLFDMIYNALDLEVTNTGEVFIFYDDFGNLTLTSLEKMHNNLTIDETAAEDFDYTSSIDEQTYNKIKLAYDNEETGTREIYITQDGQHMNDWGILQFYETLQKGENGKAKADALLKWYNTKTRNLSVRNVFGDLSIRAGSMPIVNLNLGDIVIQNHLMVERCVHKFNESEHFMDLTLRGGEFV